MLMMLFYSVSHSVRSDGQGNAKWICRSSHCLCHPWVWPSLVSMAMLSWTVRSKLREQESSLSTWRCSLEVQAIFSVFCCLKKQTGSLLCTPYLTATFADLRKVAIDVATWLVEKLKLFNGSLWMIWKYPHIIEYVYAHQFVEDSRHLQVLRRHIDTLYKVI